jgi:hypothetical protein
VKLFVVGWGWRRCVKCRRYRLAPLRQMSPVTVVVVCRVRVRGRVQGAIDSFFLRGSRCFRCVMGLKALRIMSVGSTAPNVSCHSGSWGPGCRVRLCRARRRGARREQDGPQICKGFQVAAAEKSPPKRRERRGGVGGTTGLVMPATESPLIARTR